MPRANTVELNERATQGDAAAALALLEQSMARGHGRIGLLRYLRARCLGAALELRHHDYAQRVAARMSETALACLAAEAQRRHETQTRAQSQAQSQAPAGKPERPGVRLTARPCALR
jgi:hypothetical protein